MEKPPEKQGYLVDLDNLPPMFPTHRHSPVFWEQLGRAVATFGFLEEVLGKAIFALTATRRYDESEIEGAFEKWLVTLERALSDPLGGLIDAYGKAYRGHQAGNFKNFDDHLDNLREASKIRNVICHGSWGTPDLEGKSLPLFANNKKEAFSTPIDIEYLRQTQRAVVEIICNVINSVTAMGWQFPGASGPGAVVYAAMASGKASDGNGLDHPR
jgi:hypothetical protein